MFKRAISAAVAAAFALSVGVTAMAAPATSSLAMPQSPQTEAASTTAERAALNAENAQKLSAGGWSIDPATAHSDDTLEVVNGLLHFKSSARAGNGTTAGQYPTVAVSDKSYDFSKPGSIHTIITSTQAATNTRFGYYLGYKDPGHGLFIGFDSGGWFWQKYDGKTDPYYSGSRVAAPAAQEKTTVNISWTGSTAAVNVNGKKAFADVPYSGMSLSGKLALKAGTWGSERTDVTIDGLLGQEKTYTLSGTVTDDRGQAIPGATVTVGDKTATTDSQGRYRFASLTDGTYTVSATALGYQPGSATAAISGKNLTMPTLVLLKQVPIEATGLKDSDMTVSINKNFPTVIQYKLADGKIMYGQSKSISTVRINGTNIRLSKNDVTFARKNETTADYTLRVKDAAHSIDATLTVEISIDGLALHYNVAKITNNLVPTGTKVGDEKNPVQTISFPNLSLISMRSTQKDATFTGAVMSSDTRKTGDETYPITDSTQRNDRDYMYAFLSGDGLSAGLWSNSEHDGRAVASVAGGGRNTRIFATTEKIGTATSLGLASAPWYYHRKVTDSKKNTYVVPQTDMPKSAIIIAEDENNDKTVNWEDGAIAFRRIMNNPYKSDEVPELVAYRVAMNFGSQAANPFLMSLDNIKKVALNTDGLGQSVLLKGYANEGHDSGHPDYWDIGRRMGGAKDMNTLMEQAQKYGARIGIHVNADEEYPEAKSFTDQSVRRNANGSLRYGWNWLDQAVGIDGIWDVATDARAQRFQRLKGEVGNNLDFVYVDVWGNETSGPEDSWETRKLSKMINSRGWRMANEWGAANEYDATFQHWAADLTYGGAGLKGEDSQVMRFLRNHQKDSWDGDYPSYGGAANAPLLGGYSMKDFEGWQGRNDYASYIDNLFTHDVTTKFIQHFKVSRWVNNPLDRTSVQDPKTNNGNEFIELKDGHGNVLTLSRGSNDPKSASYRNRTIILNGHVIASGAVTPGDNQASTAGTESYLLPWMWDVKTGRLLATSQQRLYHWNTRGGQTTWTLPQGWEHVSSVNVYELSDLGRKNKTTVPVVNGTVTLDAKARTPYVVYMATTSAPNMNVQWSTGAHIADTGFNGGPATLGENWDHSGGASIVKNTADNFMLKLSGNGTVSQTMTGLTPGIHYAAYVGVDNRSNSPAVMTVSANGKTLASNHTNQSIAENYVKSYAHNTNAATLQGKGSYFQNMYVFFTAPQTGATTLTLSHSGSGDAYFDDVRIVENPYGTTAGETLQTDSKGLKHLTNDFENNAQGIWPFVIAGVEGVEDNRTHLSEKHAPYTQAGWDVKKSDDVLDGNWSVKVNGLVQRNALVYQTIPQNVRFEPGRRYTVSFKYEAGSDGTYAVVVGDGPYTGREKRIPLKGNLGKPAMQTVPVMGAADGQSWFGIVSTGTAPDLQGTSGSAANFGGYQDVMVDDVDVTREDETAKTKEQAQEKLEAVTKEFANSRPNVSDAAWQHYKVTLAQAKAFINKNDATSDDFTRAFNILTQLEQYMKTAPNNDGSDAWDVATSGKYTINAGSEEKNSGLTYEGPAANANDGNKSTYWHTDYTTTDGNAVGHGTAWYQWNLIEPTTITGVRYLPRPNGKNGKIKQFRLTLTLADGSSRSFTSEFTTAVTWQKFSLPEPVKNVKTARLTVLTSAGDTANKFASAAELRLTTDRNVSPAPDNTKEQKTELSNLLDSAKALTQSDYSKDSWAELQKEIGDAQKVLNNTNASYDDIELALANLHTAINSLKPTKKELRQVIQEAKRLKKAHYTAATWAVLQSALEAGRNVERNANASLNDVRKATARILDAIAALQPTHPSKPSEPSIPTNPDNPNNPSKPGATCPALTFRDVKESDWYYSAVNYVDCRGVMKGYGRDRRLFGPSDRLLRVDAATLLWRRAGRPSVETRTHYRDQKLIPGYARMAVNWAAETHVMNGYGAQNRFGARSFLTRQEAAKIIAVASGHKVGEPSREALESYMRLGHAAGTFPGLLRFMVWAHESGAISGWDTPHGRDADPWGIVTRAQMAQIVSNAIQKGIFPSKMNKARQ